MSRPRAGHGMTAVRRGKNLVWYISNSDGEWITTGMAKGWTRCARCRRPEEHTHALSDGRQVCNTCFYYKCLPSGEFWLHKGDYLFPYSIGRRMMAAKHPARHA